MKTDTNSNVNIYIRVKVIEDINMAQAELSISCGIKISTVHCLVLSQSTCVTDGENYDSQDRASIAASRGKNSFIADLSKKFVTLLI